jgi:hypothetical protein
MPQRRGAPAQTDKVSGGKAMTRIRMGLVLGLLLALAVAGCGGGGGKSNGVASLDGGGATTTNAGGSKAGGSQVDRQQALDWARCMRQHGITTMPDPQITANGIEQQLPERMDADDPRLKAAEQACHQYGSLPPAKPGGSPSGGGGK